MATKLFMLYVFLFRSELEHIWSRLRGWMQFHDTWNILKTVIRSTIGLFELNMVSPARSRRSMKCRSGSQLDFLGFVLVLNKALSFVENYSPLNCYWTTTSSKWYAHIMCLDGHSVKTCVCFIWKVVYDIQHQISHQFCSINEYIDR